MQHLLTTLPTCPSVRIVLTPPGSGHGQCWTIWGVIIPNFGFSCVRHIGTTFFLSLCSHGIVQIQRRGKSQNLTMQNGLTALVNPVEVGGATQSKNNFLKTCLLKRTDYNSSHLTMNNWEVQDRLLRILTEGLRDQSSSYWEKLYAIVGNFTEIL